MTLFLKSILFSLCLISLPVLGGKSESTFSPRIKKKNQTLYLPKGSDLIKECLKPQIDLGEVQKFSDTKNIFMRFMPMSQKEYDAHMAAVEPLKEVSTTKSKKRKKIRLHRQKSLEEINSKNIVIDASSYWDLSTIPLGATALHIAVIRNEPRLIQVLLNTGFYEQLLTEDENRDTPLHLAIKLDRGPFNALIEDILDQSEQGVYQSYLIQALTKFNSLGLSVLHLAVLLDESSPEYVTKLLEVGASPKLYTLEPRPRSALEIALRKKRHREAIELVLAGANLPHSSDEFLPELIILAKIVSQKKIEFTEWLKEQKKIGPGFIDFYQNGMKFTQKLVAPIVPAQKKTDVVTFRYGQTPTKRAPTKSLPTGCHTFRLKDQATMEERE